MTIQQAEAEIQALAERVDATMGDDPELKGVAAMLYATLGAIRAKALHRFVAAVAEVAGREMEGATCTSPSPRQASSPASRAWR